MGQVLDRVPSTRRGQVVTLTGAAIAWIGLYWLNEHVWDWLLYGALGLHSTDRVTETIHFFLYDTAKITLLLIGIIFLVTVLRSFMSVERTRALLGGKREGVGNVMAAALGVITPYCSCSAVPAFWTGGASALIRLIKVRSSAGARRSSSAAMSAAARRSARLSATGPGSATGEVAR